MFTVALAVHIAAGLTCVIAGALAATARKRPGRHPRAGTVYVAGLAVVFASATVLAGLRWTRDRHLFAIGVVAFGLGAAGWWAHRLLLHGTAMAGSYIALLTGFYVDNGPQLPLWNRLPHIMYWFLPAAVGIPLTWLALRRNGVLTSAARRRPARRRHRRRPRTAGSARHPGAGPAAGSPHPRGRRTATAGRARGPAVPPNRGSRRSRPARHRRGTPVPAGPRGAGRSAARRAARTGTRA